MTIRRHGKVMLVVGYNAEPLLRFGVRHEHGFTAIGVWPLLIGIRR